MLHENEAQLRADKAGKVNFNRTLSKSSQHSLPAEGFQLDS